MTSKLIVVTVNYCCADEILKNLDGTVAQIIDEADGEFWIVDNHSPDGSGATLRNAIAEKSYRDRVRVLDSGRNGGFGYGNNVAAKAAMELEVPPEYLYFLNPDAAPRPGTISAFLAFMEATPDAAIAGGLLCDEAGEITTSMFRFPSFWSEIEQAINFGPVSRLLKKFWMAKKTPDGPLAVDWVAGTSFVARTEALRRCGPFDETFFLYWEEIELCHRVKSAGWGVYGIPDAVVSHVGGVSTGMHDLDRRLPRYWFESRNYFFRQTGLAGNLLALNLAVSAALILRRSIEFIRRRPLRPPRYVLDFVRYSVWARFPSIPT